MKNKARVHHIPTNKPEEWWKHLYITTDEEIKEGDWFLNTGSGGHPTPKVYQANSENSKVFKEFGPYPEIRKIIATTDPELSGKTGQLPQSFIEEYCKAGGIDEVLVEYDDKYSTLPNKFIIIHPVEEKVYSRDEVCQILSAYRVYAWKNGSTQKELDKWIEENL